MTWQRPKPKAAAAGVWHTFYGQGCRLRGLGWRARTAFTSLKRPCKFLQQSQRGFRDRKHVSLVCLPPVAFGPKSVELLRPLQLGFCACMSCGRELCSPLQVGVESVHPKPCSCVSSWRAKKVAWSDRVYPLLRSSEGGWRALP